MNQYNVLLIPGEPEWTSKALNLACAIARSNDGQVILVKMVPAGHPALLGSPEGQRSVTDDEMQLLAELATAAERYSVPVQVILCQYASYARALVDAASQLDAGDVFAALPTSRIPIWSRWQQWRVQSSLERQGCTLHTVGVTGSLLEWTPSATRTAAATSLHGKKESTA